MSRRRRSPSRNPVSELVRKAGFSGTTAEVIDWTVFAALLFIVVGVLMEGWR